MGMVFWILDFGFWIHELCFLSFAQGLVEPTDQISESRSFFLTIEWKQPQRLKESRESTIKNL
jgi:hypothetical protein